MTRSAPALLACLMLSACLSPQQGLTPYQRCMLGPSAEYRALRQARREVVANLSRGYALVRQEVAGLQTVSCSGGGRLGECLANTRVRLDLPVAIERAREEARLATIDAKIAALRPQAYGAVVTACGPLPEAPR